MCGKGRVETGGARDATASEVKCAAGCRLRVMTSRRGVRKRQLTPSHLKPTAIENHWEKMAALFRSARQFGKNLIFSESNRSVSLSATTRLREIIKKKEDNVLTIEAVRVPQKKEHLLVKLDSHACPLCAAELDVKHTDVLILSQFLRSNGAMLPRRITGLCNVQQKRVSVLVTMAQRAGLLPDRFTKRNKKGSMGQERRRFNTYYDEDTILYKYKR